MTTFILISIIFVISFSLFLVAFISLNPQLSSKIHSGYMIAGLFILFGLGVIISTSLTNPYFTQGFIAGGFIISFSFPFLFMAIKNKSFLILSK